MGDQEVTALETVIWREIVCDREGRGEGEREVKGGGKRRAKGNKRI